MKKVLNILIALILFISGYNLKAQESEFKKDSLLTLNDSVKVKHYLNKSKEYAWQNINEAEKYARLALKLSEEINYTYGIAYSKFTLSSIFTEYEFEISEKLALEAFGHAKKLQDSMLMAKIYNGLGILKANAKQYDEAKVFFHKSLKILERRNNDSSIALIYNNLGSIYDYEYPDSIPNKYYLKAVEINKTNGYNLWLAINYVNLGLGYLDKNFSDTAYSYLNKSLIIAKKDSLDRLLPWILNSLSSYYFNINDFDSSIKYSKTALNKAKAQSNILQERKAVEHIKDIFTKINKTDSALYYTNRFIVLSDSINKQTHYNQLEQLELKFKYEEEQRKQQLQNALLKAKLYRRGNMILFIVFGLIIIILIFAAIYYSQKSKLKQKTLEQQNFELQKDKLTSELEFKNKELTTNVMYLIKKNEFISEISTKLKEITNSIDNDEANNTINKLINDLNRNLNQQNWEDFEIRFHEVYVGFYKKLSNKFPNLSPNDLRMCAFLRLNMNTKEIAELTNQSADSIKTARHRLRKKLMLNRNENIVSFLMKM